MSTAPATTKYTLLMRILHWLIALFILGMIAVGWYMTGLAEEDPNRDTIYALHKSFGITVLGLVIIRLLTRFFSPIPELPRELAWWEKAITKIVHFLLYGLMLAVPISGIVMMDYLGIFPLEWFGIEVPGFIEDNFEKFEQVNDIHEILAYTLLGLIVLHLLGSLKHRFLDKNKDTDVLKRMI